MDGAWVEAEAGGRGQNQAMSGQSFELLEICLPPATMMHPRVPTSRQPVAPSWSTRA